MARQTNSKVSSAKRASKKSECGRECTKTTKGTRNSRTSSTKSCN